MVDLETQICFPDFRCPVQVEYMIERGTTTLAATFNATPDASERCASATVANTVVP